MTSAAGHSSTIKKSGVASNTSASQVSSSKNNTSSGTTMGKGQQATMSNTVTTATTGAAAAGGTAVAIVSSSPSSLLQRFPVNSLQELNLITGEKLSGRVYCTDEMSNSIVIQTALVHTTLAIEIRIISVDSVVTSTLLLEENNNNNKQHNTVADSVSSSASTTTTINVAATPLTQPLPKIHKKVLEDRERRAIRLAEESLRHINQKASAVGQAVFDRLLKACGDVVWASGDAASIVVLNQIQVDAPYEPSNCKIISKGTTTTSAANGTVAGSAAAASQQGGLAESSLDRVRKIVASANTITPVQPRTK